MNKIDKFLIKYKLPIFVTIGFFIMMLLINPHDYFDFNWDCLICNDTVITATISSGSSVLVLYITLKFNSKRNKEDREERKEERKDQKNFETNKIRRDELVDLYVAITRTNNELSTYKKPMEKDEYVDKQESILKYFTKIAEHYNLFSLLVNSNDSLIEKIKEIQNIYKNCNLNMNIKQFGKYLEDQYQRVYDLSIEMMEIINKIINKQT